MRKWSLMSWAKFKRGNCSRWCMLLYRQRETGVVGRSELSHERRSSSRDTEGALVQAVLRNSPVQSGGRPERSTQGEEKFKRGCREGRSPGQELRCCWHPRTKPLSKNCAHADSREQVRPILPQIGWPRHWPRFMSDVEKVRAFLDHSACELSRITILSEDPHKEPRSTNHRDGGVGSQDSRNTNG